MKKIALLSLSVIFMLTSCASKYNLLSPETASFSSVSKENGVELSYEYKQLRKKYAKKAYKTDIKIAAVKIKNTTDRVLRYGDDFRLTTSQGEYIQILSPNEVYDKLKQKPATHLLYLLLSPLQLQKSETDSYGYTETENIFPIGLILGPGIAAGNFIAAKNANNKFEDEIQKYSVFNQQIAPNETKTFLVPLSHYNYPNLKIKLE